MRPFTTVLLGAGASLIAAHFALAEPRGDNVIVVAPVAVTLPHSLPGDCRVRAKVLEVLDGRAFKTGELVALDVPCTDRSAVLDSRPARPTGPESEGPSMDPVVLQHSTRGYVHLDDAGRLIGAPTARGYPPYGVAFGYRVLDGVRLPAQGRVAS
jgi:hypothetical protein